MALFVSLCIIPAFTSRVTGSMNLVYNIFRDRVRILTRPRKPVSGGLVSSAKLVAASRLDEASDYADMNILEAQRRGNNEKSFATSFYDFSQHFLFSRDSAFLVHSDFDD